MIPVIGQLIGEGLAALQVMGYPGIAIVVEL